MPRPTLYGGVAPAVLLVALIGTPALGQQASSEPEPAGETVIVTGSYIRGTPEDAALPVQVVSAADLLDQGSPTIVELVKTLGISSGTDGETNQFSSNGLEGLGNINLRGLGPARTLVLLNGRRMVSAPYGISEQAQTFVDTNLIPAAAIGRVEILKDGAAALYGSDAIAGVVNFITDDRLDGLRLSGDFEYFEGTSGEYNLSAAWGHQGEDTSVVVSFGYQFRPEVITTEKDWAVLPFAENPQGGWSSIGNPGTLRNAIPFTIPGTTTTVPAGGLLAADPGCLAVGGTIAGGSCQFQFTPFDNLVEEETRWQFFLDFNHEFEGGTEWHVDFLAAKTDVPTWKTSPSYPPQRFFQVIPASHPGLQALIAGNPTWVAANPWVTGPAVLWTGRPFGWGGFPGTGGAQEGSRTYESYRISTSLDGTFANDINWTLAWTYHATDGYRETNDTFTDRFSQALRGFGGPNCSGTTPGQNGCMYYNPFSTAIQSNALTGTPNGGYVSSTANSVALAEWLTGEAITDATTTVSVFDLVFDGETGLQLGGGNVAWAAGAQYRTDTYKLTPNDNSNFQLNPCPVPGQQNCTSRTGVFAFLGPTNAANEERSVWGVFGELNLPLTERFEAQLALRHEDYGGQTGATTDPKISLRWEPIDGIVLRGSGGTTFRGPSLNQLSGQFTTLSFVSQVLAFKAVDTFGNPNLRPESATTLNFGLVVDRGGFSGSIDAWSFDFDDPIIVEPFAAILNNVLAGGVVQTSSPFFNRVTFSTDPPTVAGFERVRVNITNGPNIKTSGIDASAEYLFEDVFGGADFTVGADLSYVLEYRVAAQVIDGITVAPAFDAVGRLNRSTFLRSMPETRASVFAEYSRGDHNLRWVTRYIAEYEDERAAIAVGSPGKTIDSNVTSDLYYRWNTPWDLTFTASVVNIFDEDPPFARNDLNYDPYTHRPFGRTFKIGLVKTFGGE
jgi:iron complex outermembrane recepter protein